VRVPGIPAQAAPATVYIYKGYFDLPGSDRGSNSSLNAEYVVIMNGDNVSHSVSGWTVRDKAGHVYKFGTLRLGAGKQAIIHTGKGTSYTTSASTDLYLGRGWYVWNNTRDKVILRRADGSLKDTCSYSGAGSKTYCLGINNRAVERYLPQQSRAQRRAGHVQEQDLLP
jgi:Lamin Tail Domain